MPVRHTIASGRWQGSALARVTIAPNRGEDTAADQRDDVQGEPFLRQATEAPELSADDFLVRGQ